MSGRKIAYGAPALLVAIAGILSIWYYSSHHKISKPHNQPTTSQNKASGSTQPTPGQSTTKAYPVLVYFSKHPDSDNDPIKTFPVKRTSPDLGVAKFSIEQLLKGPTTAETGQGYFITARLRNGTSNCDGQDFKLKIIDSTATLQFCRPFDHLGSVADGQADSELKDTLKQFGTVKKVVILNSTGSCEFDLSGLNLCLQQ